MSQLRRVFLPTIALTLHTMIKSNRRSDSLDVLSDQRVSSWNEFDAFWSV
jgi:hypothetical protein